MQTFLPLHKVSLAKMEKIPLTSLSCGRGQPRPFQFMVIQVWCLQMILFKVYWVIAGSWVQWVVLPKERTCWIVSFIVLWTKKNTKTSIGKKASIKFISRRMENGSRSQLMTTSLAVLMEVLCFHVLTMVYGFYCWKKLMLRYMAVIGH